MLFENYSNIMRITDAIFINEMKVIDGIVDIPVINHKVIPSRIGSNDYYINRACLKFCSENNERKQLGYLLKKDIEFSGYNVIDKKIVTLNASEVCYGWNKRYGLMDTTGTASGVKNSSDILEKAMKEIIEKNELLLFWYSGINIRYIDYKDLKMGIIRDCILDQFENFIFIVRNISNLYTCIVITFDRNKKQIISSGVSGELELKQAIKGAIGEAIQLVSCFNRSEKEHLNRYAFVTLEESEKIYNKLLYMKNKSEEMIVENLKPINNKGIKLSSWISDLTIVYLNVSGNLCNGKTIRCCSKDLFNCIPTLQNIKLSLHKKILTEYSIDYVNSIDCIIV